MPRIAVVGSYGVGMTMKVPWVPETGETVIGGRFSTGPGGKGSNQAIAARRLDADVQLLTCIGPDGFGEEALKLWQAEGVGTSLVKTGSRPTMVGFILVEPSGENRITIAAGALDELVPDDVKNFGEAMSEADACLVSLEIPLGTACAALELAHNLGTRTLLNPAPAARLPDEVWDMVDVLTPNLAEARALSGLKSGSPEALGRALRARCRGVLVITLGDGGAYLDDGAGMAEIVPAVEVEGVVDTTGAGDAFNAALAVALTEGQSVREAVRFANRAAALCVTRPEVVPALPYRHEVEKVKERVVR